MNKIKTKKKTFILVYGILSSFDAGFT